MSTNRTKIATITDDITALGMRLAGIGDVVGIKEDEKSREVFSEYANDPEIAVLIITEDIAAENRKLINRITQRPWPVIVEIAGPEGKMEEESSTIKELVRRALGVEIEI